ncbi:MAG TPA: serine protease [Gemmataceae bacterium]|nr:serine protease [Gemmataceae bacterium]
MANSSPQAIVPKSSPSPQQPAPPANSAVPTNVPKALNTPEVILERVKRATAFIEGKNGSSGTAFVIGRGILATNSHVIRGDYLNDIRVRFIVADNVKAESLPVKLLYEDARRDLALLAVQIPDSLEPLRLAVHEKGIPAGLPVALIGNPGRLEGAYREIHAVTEGVVEGPVVFKTMDVYYHTTAEGARGTSGGPVIDSKTGDVIGVQTIGMGESRNPLARGPGPKRVSHKGASQETLCVPSIFVRDALDEVAAAPDRDQLTEQATARHLVLMVTLKICKFHENTVVAAEANKRIRQQRWGVSSRCLDVINDYSASYNRTMGELRPALRQVRNTSALRHSIKNALQEFVDNYEETKKEAVKLKVMYYKQFDDRYDGLIRKHEKLQRKLFKELEIPEHVASWLLQ